MDLRALSPLSLLILGCRPAGDRPATVDPSVPPAAAAPRGVRYPEYGAAGGIAPPADSLVNPIAGDTAAARQGQRLFSSMNCDGCHGEGAAGFVGPSLIDGRWRYGPEDGAIYQSIFYGRPRGMPAYGGLLGEATIWQLVSYLTSQPVPSVVPTTFWD